MKRERKIFAGCKKCVFKIFDSNCTAITVLDCHCRHFVMLKPQPQISLCHCGCLQDRTVVFDTVQTSARQTDNKHSNWMKLPVNIWVSALK